MRKKKTKMVTKDTYELMFGQKAQKIIQCTKKYNKITRSIFKWKTLHRLKHLKYHSL